MGTILQGTFDDQKAQIRIQGNSVSRTRSFVADIVAYEVKMAFRGSRRSGR